MVGRDFPTIKNLVASRTLAAVRERFSAAEITNTGLQPPARTLPGYAMALEGAYAVSEELSAAERAYELGATHLLVPTIVTWSQTRTDDPIGAVLSAHNRIAVDLRLMRLQPPALVDRVTFTNRARLTLNQSADGLLDKSFRDAVLRLISGK
jgi:hypothetical protein